MTSPAYFATLARYNQWANERVYDACATLSDADYRQNRRAFFGSIHGTLNHLLVTDRMWLGRTKGPESGLTQLDQILYEDFAALRTARRVEDDRIVAYTERLGEPDLDGNVDYRTSNGEPQRTRLSWILAHLFNHQTHHRGQIHDMLSQAALDPPSLDLMRYLRLNPAEAS